MNCEDILRTALMSGQPESVACQKPDVSLLGQLDGAVWRFVLSWASAHQLGPDQFVLLRQVARWSKNKLFVGKAAQQLIPPNKAGVSVDGAGRVIAEPFRPTWLHDDPIVESVGGLDEIPVWRRPAEGDVAEPYVQRLGFANWRSAAQKEAVWRTITAPQGSATLIILPTGMGKSLCFQLVSLLDAGLTVVVVPTVALAIDQWESAKRVFNKAYGGQDGAIHPRYFAAGDPDLNPDTVVRDISTGATRLVFTSPEACVSGRLRPVLDQAARDGRLANIVFDEAHLVESWGGYFRIEFQILAGLCRKWTETSGGRARIFLFSATVTPSCRQLLHELFGTEKWSEFTFQQLRGEMTCFNRHFDTDEVREQAVIDCVWKLPRPMILYVTERKHAREWADRIRDVDGFQRLGCFHGETPPTERRQLIQKWREDKIDLMVATSAFGVGVDKPDVRSVVHACLPEDLNRYYQEIGRSGRDGRSSVCVLVPTRSDYRTAKSMTPKLLKPQLLQKRWTAMWASREWVDQEKGIARVSPHTRRDVLKATRTGKQNVKWNKRLIMQLERAGLLQLCNLEYRPGDADEDPEEWIEVRLNFDPHSSSVGQLIESQRQDELRVAGRGLGEVSKYLRGERCLGRLLRDLYGDETLVVCGACPACRRRGSRRTEVPVPDWDEPRGSARRSIILQSPDPTRQSHDLTDLLRRCVEFGIRRFAVDQSTKRHFVAILPTLFPSRQESYRLDDLDAEPPFLVQPDERLVVFHIGQVHIRGIRLTCGSAIFHVLDQRLTLADVLREVANADIFSSPDHWMQHLGRNV